MSDLEACIALLTLVVAIMLLSLAHDAVTGGWKRRP